MNGSPPSFSEKFAQAAVLWLFASFFSIPLWDLAGGLSEAYRDGSLPSAVMESILNPAGIILGLLILFAIRAEDGIRAIVSHYWPAFLISSALTALFLRWWWRRS